MRGSIHAHVNRPATALDHAVGGLLDLLGVDRSPAVVIGHPDCPSSEFFIPTHGLCCAFGAGAVITLERLSQGRANAWHVVWTADGAAIERGVMPSRESSPIGEVGGAPWRVVHPDGGLFAFPLDMEVSIGYGAAAIRLPRGTMLGRLQFFPGGSTVFSPRLRSYSVARAFGSFPILDRAIDQAEERGFSAPEWIVGDIPSERLRDFSRYFGFEVMDTFGHMTSVIARTGVVRDHARANADRGARLMQRALKQQSYEP